MSVKKLFNPGTIFLVLFAAALIAVPVSAAALNADCGTITDPVTDHLAPNSGGMYLLKANRNYTVSLTFRNAARLHTGAWKDSFGLAPKGDAKLFNATPSMIPAGITVHEGDKYTFKFKIHTPGKKGLYDLRWQMFEGLPMDFFGRTGRWDVRVRA